MSELTPELRADFLEWLKTGSFRGVRLGMTRAECIEKLGEPDDWGGVGKSQRRAGIYRWSLLEFHFATQKAPADPNNDELYFIWNDRTETTAALFGYGYDDNKIISLLETEELLRQAGMKYSKYLVTNENLLKEGQNIILIGEYLSS